MKIKIFISWSGLISGQVALALRNWIPNVVQAAEPYVSSKDITKGKRWPNELGERLEAVNYGIICLTPGNLTAPWIYFEAGALGKSLNESLVVPFLFKLKKSDVNWPLAQFQMTAYERDDVFKMMQAINALAEEPLDPPRLTKSFDLNWPELQAELDSLLVQQDGDQVDSPSNHRSDQAILEELLELARGQQRKLNAAAGDRFFTFRGNERIDPLSAGDYRQLAMGLAMLKTLAEIERIGAYKPEAATIKTLLMLRDPLELILARAHAPRISSVYFIENGGSLSMTYEEEDRRVEEPLDAE